MRPTRLQRRYWHLGTLFWVVYLLFDLPTVVRGSRSGARTTVQLTLLAVLVAAYLYVIGAAQGSGRAGHRAHRRSPPRRCRCGRAWRRALPCTARRP